MGLTDAIQIGRSGLLASQAGLAVTGNNIANASTPGYSRQTALLEPARTQDQGSFSLGRGVLVGAVERQVDEALLDRLRSGLGDEAASAEEERVLSQLEGVLNELTEFDVSSELDAFFNAWADATNLIGSEAVVVERGDRLASVLRRVRQDAADLRTQIDNQLDTRVSRADALLDEVAALNGAIIGAETGQSPANGLRDRRDEALAELSTLLDVNVQNNGDDVLNVFVGSTPVLVGGENRGLEVERRTEGDALTARVVLKSDGSEVSVSSGSVGGLLGARDGEIDATIERLDELAATLIFEVNKLHAEGRGTEGLTSAVSERPIPTSDRTLAFNDPANATFSGLPFSAEDGSFIVEVRNPGTRTVTETTVDVDLDGRDAGAVSFANDTSPASLAADLDAIDGLSASIDAAGRLRVTADPGFEFSFRGDTSGVLGVLGLNGYFTGTNALNIGVRADLLEDPSGLTLGTTAADGTLIENGTALAVAALGDQPIDALSGRSVRESWNDRVQAVAVRTSTARTNAEASRLVRESLQAQRDALSGVSLDEESINLLQFQQQFNGSARVIAAADELLNTLIAIL